MKQMLVAGGANGGMWQMMRPWILEGDDSHLKGPFRIAATEVTQGQWNALMPTNRSPEKGDALPVSSVSWNEAQEFCARLTEKEGMRFATNPEALKMNLQGIFLDEGRRILATA